MSVDQNDTHARKVLGENLKRIRIEMGLNQVDFAQKIGLKQGDLSKIETGVRGFNSDSLTELARNLGVEPWRLLAPANIAAASGAGHSTSAELSELRRIKAELDRIYGPDGIRRLLLANTLAAPTVLNAADMMAGSTERQKSPVKPAAVLEGPGKKTGRQSS